MADHAFGRRIRIQRRCSAVKKCLAAALAAIALALALPLGAFAADPQSNINAQNYNTWDAAPVSSYLFKNGQGGVTRVERTGSVGLDMIAVPGDTSASSISAIIADEAAIGMINQKTTAVRVIPVPGKGVGDFVDFGGLLGRAPVMAVNPAGSEKFIARGGRIPAPINSLKN